VYNDQVYDCLGQKECHINLDEDIIYNKNLNTTRYVFVNTLCKDTEVRFEFGGKMFQIKKKTIATVTALCDIIAVFIFAIGISLYFLYLNTNRLSSYENKEVKEKMSYVEDYSIEVHQLDKLNIKDPLAVKEELWEHLESLVQSVYPDAKVCDIQLALNDTKNLNLVQTLKKETNILRLMEKRIERKYKQPKLNKQIAKVQQIRNEVNNCKSTNKESHPIKAFVTFSSIEAADYIKKLYSTQCCKCCDEKYKNKE